MLQQQAVKYFFPVPGPLIPGIVVHPSPTGALLKKQR